MHVGFKTYFKMRKCISCQSPQADRQEEDGDFVNTNRQASSETLHYTTVVFPGRAGSEIKGTSSLTAEYASVHHGSKPQNKGGMTETGAEGKGTEQLKLSDGAEVIYAQVKPRK